jgi:hypothetical protein
MSRPRLSYANVVSSLALFIAIGGTSYAAATLPHNSVGASQIRSSAVGSSEIKNGAVHLADIAKTTTKSLRGAQGPPGPVGPAGAPGAAAVSYFETVGSAGQFIHGNATGGRLTVGGSGKYVVSFSRNVSDCTYTATLGGTDQATQPAGSATVNDAGGGQVGIQTYDAAGNPADRGFHLIVAC